jgi:phasin
MSEAFHASKSKTKPGPNASGPAAFEFPKFEVPNFDMPKMEVPAAFREFAEKGASQVKVSCDKMKAATDEATVVIEGSYATATKGAADYGLKLFELSRANTAAAFDFYTELMSVKSYSDVIELSTAHARKQFETMTAQTKDLTALAQKVATETVEPIKDGVSKVFAKVS